MFHGWRVVAATFVLATFGWGLGFYGPPIYLHAVREARGWSLPLVSTAVTVHFLVGAAVIACLPGLYRRFGVATVTKTGVLALAGGVFGWAIAGEPWQLFAATILSGGGWVTMGAAAVNAIISPWFVRTRSAALASAYNGSSIGGVVFSPLWVVAIDGLGFLWATLLIGFVAIVTIWVLADRYFAKSPSQMGLAPDGDAPGSVPVSITAAWARPLPGHRLWRSFHFATLSAAMALALFAQIGLLAHLFSLLVPALGAQLAGIALGSATATAIAGRSLVGWLMPPGADRRLVAAANYAVQIAGTLTLLVADGESVPLLLLGVVLFGAGIGNTTSLPPLIAQVEFVRDDVARAVPLMIAIGQATYAFAPAFCGLVREMHVPSGMEPTGAAPPLFIVAASIQGLAIMAILVGRRTRIHART
jgi:hypothetical protein